MNQIIAPGLPGAEPDLRRSRALMLLHSCEAICSLSIPAFANQREKVLKASAFIEALKQLMDAGEGVDPLHALSVLMIQRGAEAGLNYSQTLETLLVAYHAAAHAHAETIGAANDAAEAAS